MAAVRRESTSKHTHAVQNIACMCLATICVSVGSNHNFQIAQQCMLRHAVLVTLIAAGGIVKFFVNIVHLNKLFAVCQTSSAPQMHKMRITENLLTEHLRVHQFLLSANDVQQDPQMMTLDQHGIASQIFSRLKVKKRLQPPKIL